LLPKTKNHQHFPLTASVIIPLILNRLACLGKLDHRGINLRLAVVESHPSLRHVILSVII
jgi:hypothetical protein